MPTAKTVIAFHAHPDDEVLVTGGTLARLAAEGHRTVVVVACDGVMGDAREPGASRRMEELRASARVLGVARVEHLGYADSGHGPLLYEDPPDRVRFVRAPLDEAAGRLAAIIRQERADLLLSYDPNGGYGHRDHVRVHEVGARAAELTGVRVLEGTVPREPIVRIGKALQAVRILRRYDFSDPSWFGTARADITHRVDVRRYAAAKQAALAEHQSQMGNGRGSRMHLIMSRLPVPIYGRLAGREWYVERTVRPRAGSIAPSVAASEPKPDPTPDPQE